MPANNSSIYARYLPYKSSIEVAYWVLKCVTSAMLNSIVVIMEYQREGENIAAWRPMTWEWSSNLVILALIPAMVAFTNRYPLHWDTWKHYLPKYVMGSLLFSVVHVLAMVGLRKLVYAIHGDAYDFGNWPVELFYEYIKDAQSFLGIVITLHAYRWLMRRLQGEASLLALSADEPDHVVVENFLRPERFLVRMLNREFLIAAVDMAQASGNYVNLHVAGRVYPLRSTMAQFETQLDPTRFVRIHRSHLVNIRRIASIEPLDSGDARIHLHDGTIVACSRRYREALKL
jgi:hypothetical protein